MAIPKDLKYTLLNTEHGYFHFPNSPTSRSPNPLIKSVLLKRIATPRTPEPIETSTSSSTDWSTITLMGPGSPKGATAPSS